jgi:Cys-tRNA(Pro)/Cys-tRNA(Cys) deacylase
MAAVKIPDSLLPKLVQFALNGVNYEITQFPDTMRDAEEIAAALGLPPEQIFKTLVVTRPQGQGKPFLAMMPANRHLNLKKLAKTVGEKKLVMASHAEAEKLTGLQVGGISALALRHKNFKVYLDQSAAKFAEIYVSGGQRGLDVKLAVTDLVRLTQAKMAALA